MEKFTLFSYLYTKLIKLDVNCSLFVVSNMEIFFIDISIIANENTMEKTLEIIWCISWLNGISYKQIEKNFSFNQIEEQMSEKGWRSRLVVFQYKFISYLPVQCAQIIKDGSCLVLNKNHELLQKLCLLEQKVAHKSEQCACVCLELCMCYGIKQCVLWALILSIKFLNRT